MPAIVHPEFSTFETIEATMDVDLNGFAQVRVSYYARTDSDMITLLNYGTPCPLISAGMLASAVFLHGSANTVEGGWKVSVFWKGIAANYADGGASVPTYKPIAQTAPIDTHPNFLQIAGQRYNEEHGAIFDDQGSFVRFSPFLDHGGEVSNPFAGITSYYQAVLKVGETHSVKHDRIQLANLKVGTICTPDFADRMDIQLPDAPDYAGYRNFLLSSVKLEDMGNGYALLEREWDMSGPYGWDSDIYSSS